MPDDTTVDDEQDLEATVPAGGSPVPRERVLELLRAAEGRPVSQREIWQELHLGPDERVGLRALLAEAVDEGVLERLQGRKYLLKRQKQQPEVVGVVHRHERGFGWLLGTGTGGTKGGDPYIPPEEMDGVLHGDRVRARLLPGREGKWRALIEEILDRSRRAVGTALKRGRVTWVELSAMEDPLLLEEDGAAARVPDGAAVLIEVTQRGGAGRSGKARLLSVLGRPGDLAVELARILVTGSVRQEFPPEALAEANSVNADVEADAKQDPQRRDIQHLPLVTIDGEDARDFDDAVCVEAKDGKLVLTVAIADVAHYVREDSALDGEAAARGTSIYLPDRAIPMLPPRLSSTLCSLLPHTPRLCLVARMVFGRGPLPEHVELFRGLMRSHARLTYTRVAEVMDQELAALPEAPGFDLVAANGLYRKLRAARADRGALDLDLPEVVVNLDANGEPTGLRLAVRHDANRLIEEFMIAANEAVARRLDDAQWPGVYRIHDQPDPEKLERFRAVANAHAVEHRLGKDPSPKELAIFLEELAEHPAARTLQTTLLRSLMQARYQVENAGHYGLASAAYLHFTSPIRRYPDLLVHRQVLRLLDFERGTGRGAHPKDTERLSKLAEAASAAERKAVETERAVHALYAARVCQQHLGETFAATVMACTEIGLFVQMRPLLAEGLLPISSLGQDRLEMDELGTALFNRRSGLSYRAGDEVWVRIAEVNLVRRQVTLEPAEPPAGDHGETPAEKPRPARRKPAAPKPAAKAPSRKAAKAPAKKPAKAPRRKAAKPARKQTTGRKRR